MAGVNEPPENEAEEANDRLSEGLKSCRAVMSNYRALLDKKSGKGAAKDNESLDPTTDQAE